MTAITSDELMGKTGPEIASMVAAGELTQKAAEKFVADRAVRKLRKAIAKSTQA